jgi:hypothetical protein
LETEARKLAEANLPDNELERQGALDTQEPGPSMGPPLGEREVGDESPDRVQGTHSPSLAAQDLGGPKGRTIQAPKRRRKKSSLTVRKGSSKRRGSS